MKKLYSILIASTLVLLLIKCQKQISSTFTRGSIMDSLVACGQPFDTTLINYFGQTSGHIRVMNDNNKYYVIISHVFTDYKIERVQLLYGTKQHVIDNIVGLFDCATMQPRNPDVVVNYNPGQDTVVIPLAFDTLSCFYMNANVTMVKRDPVTQNISHSFYIWSNGTANPSQNSCQQYFQYCRQQCGTTPPPATDCGQLRSESQEDWGDAPNNNNAAAYLYPHFTSAFPTGLQVGCSGGYNITMTTPQAITDFLPTEGHAAALKKNYTNPQELRNVLAGQLIALTLNIKFDLNDPNFGAAARHLVDMYIVSGKFKGKKVSEFLDIANKVLGKCSSAYSPSLINNVAQKINKNYKSGTSDHHFLVCQVSSCHDDEDEDKDEEHDDNNDDHHDDDHG